MKIEIELKTEIASKQAAPWCTGNWLQTHVGAVGCLNVVNAFCCFLRFNYSNVKSLCWLPCARLHSNTQFEAEVRELLKDRLDLESSAIFSQQKNKISLGSTAVFLLACYCDLDILFASLFIMRSCLFSVSVVGY